MLGGLHPATLEPWKAAFGGLEYGLGDNGGNGDGDGDGDEPGDGDRRSAVVVDVVVGRSASKNPNH